jgi:alkylation response protein AidB-like acyl-CoA dehydrogenase
MAVEAISRMDASVGVVMVASNLAAAIIDAHATDDQRQRYLAPAIHGELGALSFALTEPGAGSDAGGITTHAVRDRDGWVLNGTKQWITGAAGAQLFLVFARTPELGDGAVTAFLVKKDTPGFSLGRVEDKLGLCSSGTAVLQFDDARVSDTQVLGAPGKGYAAALSGIGASRLAIAAQSIGIAERALELGMAYAADRKAFGVPLNTFQNTRFTIADCRTELDQAWLLMLRGARLLDRDGAIRSEASMAKLAASEMCGRVVDKMLQVHGGNGYSRDYEIERLYRDARVMRIFEGTSEIQREVIARALLGRAETG